MTFRAPKPPSIAARHRARVRLGLAIAVPATLLALACLSSGVLESEGNPQVVPARAAIDPHPVVAIEKGTDYAKTTLAAVNDAGGLASLVKKGSSVFIKVNIVGAAPAGVGKVTDWRVVQAVVTECRRLGAATVKVGESPVDDSGMAGFKAAGYGNLKGAELIATDVPRDQCRLVTPQKSMLGQGMYLPKVYLDSDVVISIPVFKIHGAAGVTLGLKNVGIGIPPKNIYLGNGSKWGLHDLGMNKVITEVSLIRRPDFVVVDGMVGGEGEGPNDPTPIDTNLVLASRDVVAVDTVGSLLMGVNPEQVSSIQYAAAQGIGVTDITAIKVVGKSIASARRDFVRPTPYGYPFKRTTTVRATTTDMRIDADLSDWTGAWDARIGDATQYMTAPGAAPVDWRNCSARIAALHDLNNLYFAFRVRDDQVVTGPGGDTVEVLVSNGMPFLEANPEDQHTRARHTANEDFVLTATVPKSGEAPVLLDSDTHKPVPGAQVAFAPSPDGYVAELVVPVAALKRRPLKEREEIWLDYAVDDVDQAGGQALKAMWNDVNLGEQYRSPSTLGRAFIDPLPVGAVAAGAGAVAPQTTPMPPATPAAPTTPKAAKVAKTVDPFIAQVEAVPVYPGHLALTWIGQAGYILRGKGRTVYVDPYLSDSLGADDRMYPLPVAAGAVTDADLVFVSHPHQDHYDPETIPPLMEASPQATLVLQAVVKDMEADTLSEGALARTHAVMAGDTVTMDGVKATAVPSHHDLAVDPDKGYENLGYVFDIGGVTVYHTGDSLYWKQMPDAVRKALDGKPLDILLVPINGKWGNMTYKDAVKLTQDLSPNLVIPIHYGTLKDNTVDPSIFVQALKAAAPTQAYRVMEPNSTFVYSR